MCSHDTNSVSQTVVRGPLGGSQNFRRETLQKKTVSHSKDLKFLFFFTLISSCIGRLNKIEQDLRLLLSRMTPVTLHLISDLPSH